MPRCNPKYRLNLFVRDRILKNLDLMTTGSSRESSSGFKQIYKPFEILQCNGKRIRQTYADLDGKINEGVQNRMFPSYKVNYALHRVAVPYFWIYA